MKTCFLLFGYAIVVSTSFRWTHMLLFSTKTFFYRICEVIRLVCRNHGCTNIKIMRTFTQECPQKICALIALCRFGKPSSAAQNKLNFLVFKTSHQWLYQGFNDSCCQCTSAFWRKGTMSVLQLVAASVWEMVCNSSCLQYIYPTRFLPRKPNSTQIYRSIENGWNLKQLETYFWY